MKKFKKSHFTRRATTVHDARRRGTPRDASKSLTPQPLSHAQFACFYSDRYVLKYSASVDFGDV